MTRKEIITQYARDCIDDRIPSCIKHKNACRRWLRDLKKSEKYINYPYYWDESAAENIVQWFHLLRHSKGELAGQPIDLTPWQQFHICQLYGWKRKTDGRRRFKKMFVEVGRKNAKSQELAGILLYDISVTSTKNQELAETYTAGTKRDQSKIVFDECGLMLRGSPLQKKFKITNQKIEHIKTQSYIKALSKDDGRNGDGSNPAVLVLDEYHQHKTTEFYDLSIGSNTKEPLLVIITTAGVDLNVPCYREYQFCASVLDPDCDVEDEEYLIDINEQDEEEAADPRLLKDSRLWIKSNPIRATYDAGIEKIRTTYEKAMKVPEDMPACLTKNFDIWLQAKANGYMDMRKWKKCEVERIPIDITGMHCTVGIDISSKIDLTSAVFVIPFQSDELDAEGEPITKYILKHHSFIPNRDKLIERINVDKVPYDAWEREGYLTVTDSQVVDQKAVMLWVLDFAKKYQLHIDWWCLDPANASLFLTILQERGENAMEIYQSYSGLNDATVGLREAVYEGNIIYEPDPLLNFAMYNAVTRRSDGKIKIDKDATRQRIDPVDATICGFKMAQFIQQSAKTKKQAEDDLRAYLKMLQETL